MAKDYLAAYRSLIAAAGFNRQGIAPSAAPGLIPKLDDVVAQERPLVEAFIGGP